jgi:hypothetical protein
MRRALGTSVMQVREAPLLLIDVLTEEGITGCAYLFCCLPAAGPAASARQRRRYASQRKTELAKYQRAHVTVWARS